jgi:8-amino-7-oxononanoate synthase
VRTILVTGSDTGVGKTHVVAALVRLLATKAKPDVPVGLDGARIQIVKVVETGRSNVAAQVGLGVPAEPSDSSPHTDKLGDAATALRLSGVAAEIFTLACFTAPIAPAAAAAADGEELSCESLLDSLRALPPCDYRILEGAGGVATPIDDTGRDWIDFAVAVGVDAIVVVVPDRLGAINQGRLAYLRAGQAGVPAGLWLNATQPVDAVVAASTRAGLGAANIPIWAEQAFGAVEANNVASILTGAPFDASEVDGDLRAPSIVDPNSNAPGGRVSPRALIDRCRTALVERDQKGLRRTLRTTARKPGVLNLADNDYLDLAHDPEVVAAVAEAAARYGTSASASPLITGWGELHAQLIDELAAWHGFPAGLLWSSGFAANAAVLGGLPTRDDIVFADRLIHHSMIAGLLHSGARLQRYEHLNLDRLEAMLAGADRGRRIFVVTETVFSMDGNYPDLARMAELKRQFGFFWVIDEAHALGWYGPQGAGLVRAAGVEGDVDVLVGTFGKTLASGGAYALFRQPEVRDYLMNTAGEFIYSTSLPPTSVAAARAALRRVRVLAAEQSQWHEQSRRFRSRLREAGWNSPDGDSPIIPVILKDPAAAMALAESLRNQGVLAAAVRPPTVPAGTSRLRFSLKRSFSETESAHVIAAMGANAR